MTGEMWPDKTQMSNPFQVPDSAKAEQERSRRRQFKTVVQTVLLAVTCFLLGMLIQGCKDQQRRTDRIGADEPVLVQD